MHRYHLLYKTLQQMYKICRVLRRLQPAMQIYSQRLPQRLRCKRVKEVVLCQKVENYGTCFQRIELVDKCITKIEVSQHLIKQFCAY